jgi:hypothetical protein
MTTAAEATTLVFLVPEAEALTGIGKLRKSSCADTIFVLRSGRMATAKEAGVRRC